MAENEALSIAKKCVDVIIKAFEALVGMGITFVTLIFFVPVFLAEGLLRLFRGRPPKEPDTEEIMVPLRKPRIRTIDIAKVDAAFPVVEYATVALPLGGDSANSTPAPPEPAAQRATSTSETTIARPEFEPEKTCSVCLTDFALTDKVRQLTCRHIFHQHCLDEWFTKYHSYCPLCQLDFHDPANPKALDKAEATELVMSPLTVTRAKQREFWLDSWLNGS